ncbi:hypothetical protein MHB50_03365 [Siminovitchia sp. FSL H7-0308]|jgi:hypothetical protein|uniref:Uncharacterized protein n=1 Tax=Siminovitchia thermophila TaxID=1245522 RepID=A0ABS2R2Z7_9BACI|nr:hypothetical protein [Siminovitchia thermophila]MBM7714018.1 hypothetical protein [Siminovitchia thermophila]
MLSIVDSFMIYMPFLYFPEDKSEYIPAAISMAIFGAACVLTFIFIKRVSKKQELKTKEIEERINRERNSKHV